MIRINLLHSDAKWKDAERHRRARREARRGLFERDPEGQRLLAKRHARRTYLKNRERVLATQRVYNLENRERLLRAKREAWAADKEENHRKRAEYRKVNKEQCRIYSQRTHERHREKHLANMREYQARNREVLKAKAREWYEKAKGDPGFSFARRTYAKTLYDKNFFRTRASRFRYRYKCDITGRELWSLWKAQRGRCALTGEPLNRDAHIDHIIAVARGGATTKQNLRFLSARANLIKRHHTDEELLNFCSAMLATAGGSHSGP